MTYEYLQDKMEEYLSTLTGGKDEWYCSEREIHEVGLEGFMLWLADNA